MRLTIIGSGDAFGSGGRFNTCFFLETAKGKLLVDCGASSLVALKAQGLDPNEVDGIVLSHLHGDHFGALPFLLLDAQFLTRRERPLLIAGPPGTRTRLDQSLEVFFPRSSANKWRFSWKVIEIEIARPLKPRLPDLRARRIMLTHMNPVMLAHLDEVRAARALVAEDGAVIDL